MYSAYDTSVTHGVENTASGQEHLHQQSHPVSSTSIPGTRRTARQSTKPQWLSDYVTAALTIQNKVLYPTANQVVATHLTPKYQAFLSAIDRQRDPSSFAEVVQSQIWCDAMNVELQALERNET